ncbi:WD40 repeat domain-containing serine/threonine-protein kinase [Spirillospora sp. NPDC029432]|uniref:WD40 repeat domain-containing serine/threonine protein kinase n=1 Tax=Spirillospora sp. NPDC029432 TaxID=3154599 RepID=UPI00345205D2
MRLKVGKINTRPPERNAMAASPLVPGDPRQLGGYWLAGRLGAGGQGVVYEAYGPAGDRVAVKALHGEFVEERRRGMLAKEVEAARRVAAFCTARILDADLEADLPYVVSEFVPGPDLQRAVEHGGPYGADALERLAVAVATALAAIHRAGVVHRDLKPANVLLGPDGPRVIDFGLARTEDMTRSRTGVKGTPRYMAPEAFGQEPVGAAADVWAWGAVVLFTALGRAPFDGGNLAAVMNAVLHRRPDLDVLPESLRPIVAAALSRDPKERPSSQQVLMALLDGGTETAALLAAGSEAAAGAAPAGEAPQPTLGDAAESVYARLDPVAQEAVPRVLLRMVLPGEGADDTLRRAPAADFAGDDAAGRVIGAFTAAGLLTRDGGMVAIANAALLRAWPRLRAWVDAERGGLAVHQSLAEAARTWADGGRRSGDLYQGTRLRRALDWAATGRTYLVLNAAERAFLDAGSALARRRVRLRGLLTGVLAVLLIVAVTAVVIVFDQRRTVTLQRDEAVGARLADRSAQLRDSDPLLGRRLALAAADLTGGEEAHRALVAARYQGQRDVWLPPGRQSSDTDLSLGHDGEVVIGRTSDRVVLWDAGTHRRIGTFGARLHSHVALGPDRRLAAARELQGGNARLFDVATGRPVGASLGTDLSRFRFSSSGNLLMADREDAEDDSRPAPGEDGRAVLWDVRGGKPVLEWDRSPGEWAVSPDDRRVALAFGKAVELWDVRQRKKISEVRDTGMGTVHKIAWRPGRDELALGFARSVWFVDPDELEDPQGGTRTVNDPGFVLEEGAYPNRSVDVPVFSADGRFMAIGFRMWDLDVYGSTHDIAGQPLFDLPARRPDGEQSEFREDCRFTPDARVLRCAGAGRVVSLNIGDVTGRTVIAPPGGRSALLNSTFSADGSLLATTGGGQVHLWDARRRTLLPGLPTGHKEVEHDPTPMRLSPDGRYLAIMPGDHGDPNAAYSVPRPTIDVWDTRRRTKITSFRPTGRAENAVPVFLDGGRTIAVENGTDTGNRLLTWDVASGRFLRETPIGGSGAAAFDPGGRWAVVPSRGLVDTHTGEARSPYPPMVRTLAVSPDGTRAFGQDARDPVLWDLKRRTRVPAGDIASALKGRLGVLAAFTPDGSLLATAHQDGDVQLWDAATGRQYGTVIAKHAGKVKTLAFSADGAILYSMGDDGSVIAASISPGRLLDELCATVGPLTERQWAQQIPQAPYRNPCRP